MALSKGNSESELVNRFWPRYRRMVLIRLVFGMVVFSAVLSALIVLLFPSIPTLAWIVMSGGILVLTFGLSFSVVAALRPLDELVRALVHVSGEPTSSTPPNLNEARYERNHLRPLLKLVYELDASRTSMPDEAHAPGREGPVQLDISKPLNHTSTGIIMLDSHGEILYANQSAPVAVGKDGKKSVELVFDVDQSIADWVKERGEHDVHAEHVWRRVGNKLTGEPDRRLFDVYVSYEKGSEVETIITLFDTTKQNQPEDDDLDFIAFAAHELRGPITVIRGYLDTLNDELADVTDADQKELFGRLMVSANRLSGYVNNILNASRFDRRHLKIHLEEQSIAKIYDMVADDMQMRAHAQQRLLSVAFPDGLPTVAADINSMSEVMANLIDNAIKYSNDGGSIEVTAGVNGNFVEVSVADNGIGMPANVIGNLFDKFYRSHRSRETVAGTGIGLYISKAIVESNGGKISVKSVEGRGSTFMFSLPIYSTVADKLKQVGDNNQAFIENSSIGWIKNHGAFRG
jgi:signal transduction histidine kinase